MPSSVGSNELLREYLDMDKLRQDFPSRTPSRSSTLGISPLIQMTSALAAGEHSPLQADPLNAGEKTADRKEVPSAVRSGHLEIPQALRPNAPILLSSPNPGRLEEINLKSSEGDKGDSHAQHIQVIATITGETSVFGSPPAQSHRSSPAVSPHAHGHRVKETKGAGTASRNLRPPRNQRGSTGKGSTKVDAKEHDCPISGCASKFTRSDNVGRHVRKVHKKEIEWTCPICDSSKTRTSNGPQHIQQGHSISGTCPVCQGAFDKKGMVAHLAKGTPCCNRIVQECKNLPTDERDSFKVSSRLLD